MLWHFNTRPRVRDIRPKSQQRRKSCTFPDSPSHKLTLGKMQTDFSENLAWHHPRSRDEGLTVPASSIPAISEKDVFANAQKHQEKYYYTCSFIQIHSCKQSPTTACVTGVNLQALRKRKCRAMRVTCSAKQPGTDNAACKVNGNGASGAVMQELG